ncbi:unnamed protein product, partial [Meganyctiphanes norvegica]
VVTFTIENSDYHQGNLYCSGGTSDCVSTGDHKATQFYVYKEHPIEDGYVIRNNELIVLQPVNAAEKWLDCWHTHQDCGYEFARDPSDFANGEEWTNAMEQHFRIKPSGNSSLTQTGDLVHLIYVESEGSATCIRTSDQPQEDLDKVYWDGEGDHCTYDHNTKWRITLLD